MTSLSGPGEVIALVATAFVLVAALGCTNTNDGLRQELSREQASWAREVATLRAQQGVLSDRFERQRAGGGSKAGGLNHGELRLRATLDGARQSVVDVELEARQSASRVEQGIARGGDEAEKSLAAERAQMRGYFEALGSQLASAGHQLDDLSINAEGSKAN